MRSQETHGIPKQIRRRKAIPLDYIQGMFRPAPHFVVTGLVRKVTPEEAEQLLGHHFDLYRAEFDQMIDASPLRGRSDVARDRESYLRMVAHHWECFKSLMQLDWELWYFDYSLRIGDTRPRQRGIAMVENETPMYAYDFFKLRHDADNAVA